MTESNLTSPALPIDKAKNNKKYILLSVVLLLIFLIIILVAGLVTLARQEDKNTNSPTVRPSATVTPTTPITVTPTVELTVTSTEDPQTQEYVFPDCEIELMAKTEWISSPRDEMGTCGILSTTDINGLTSLKNYDGALIAVLPFTADSVFAPVKQKTYREYLDKMETRTNRFNTQKDFLYNEQNITLDSLAAVKADIYSAQLGETTQVFYTGIRGEYIILWGGMKIEGKEEEIQDIIDSVKYLHTVSTQEE